MVSTVGVAQNSCLIMKKTHCCVLASLRILIRYCVILVIRCLHLWTVKLGQY